jgi:hypothetical protein
VFWQLNKGTVAGYVILFLILFMLIGVHPGFVLLFFLAIILVIIYNVRKRRNSKQKTPGFRNDRNTLTPSKQNSEPTLPKKARMGFSEFTIENETQDKKPDVEHFVYSNPPVNNLENKTELQNKEIEKPSPKKLFDYAYWDIQKYPILSAKRQKFLEAIEFCEKNNLGSKSKIRRLVIKLDKWKIENERDIDALLPEYDYLLDLIKDFQKS